MAVFVLIICLALCIGLGVFLLYVLLQKPDTRESFRILMNGIKEGFKGAGFLLPRKYPVELYVWEPVEDDDVCEDCLERSSLPPMDIADWMKEGLPGTPEAETECGEKCRCRLVLYNPRKATRRKSI